MKIYHFKENENIKLKNDSKIFFFIFYQKQCTDLDLSLTCIFLNNLKENTTEQSMALLVISVETPKIVLGYLKLIGWPLVSCWCYLRNA